MVKLHTHTTEPFIMHVTLHKPPAIMEHRFCIMVRLVMSSHAQVSFTPPSHFSAFIVQRGTIIIEGAIWPIMPTPIWGAMPGMVIALIVGMPDMPVMPMPLVRIPLVVVVVVIVAFLRSESVGPQDLTRLLV